MAETIGLWEGLFEDHSNQDMFVIVVPERVGFKRLTFVKNAAAVHKADRGEWTDLREHFALAHPSFSITLRSSSREQHKRKGKCKRTPALTFNFAISPATLSPFRMSTRTSWPDELSLHRTLTASPKRSTSTSLSSSSSPPELPTSPSITPTSFSSTKPSGSTTIHSGTLYHSPLLSKTPRHSMPLGQVHSVASSRAWAPRTSPDCKLDTMSRRALHISSEPVVRVSHQSLRSFSSRARVHAPLTLSLRGATWVTLRLPRVGEASVFGSLERCVESMGLRGTLGRRSDAAGRECEPRGEDSEPG